jgi:hypothetical protein
VFTNIRINFFFCVLPTVDLDILCNENKLDSLVIVSLFRQPTSICLVIFISHHQEVFTAYVQKLVRVIRLD